MGLTVVWMRHAKSSWDAPVADAKRELAPRGLRNATTAGEVLRDRGLSFDLVVLSPAERARQTWRRVSEAGVTAAAEREEQAVYEADAAALVRLVADSGAGTVLVVGHSPSIVEAVELSAARTGAKPWAAFDLKVPTAAMAFVEADSGEDLVAGKGRLVDFVVPR